MEVHYEVISSVGYFRCQIARETAGRGKIGSLFIHKDHLESRLFELWEASAYSQSATLISLLY